ncbi:MAG TPA: hypothetical protein PLO80_09155 [Bacteroidales bacterium]|nr:hypothetical protein [Bacteroidales bacterium]MDI9532571.1 hypothetical protein [Bacteroidota bacterium]MBP7036574.1 hypothetical protein [Bacteroidales bacterium]MBP8709337.1 hypothetical protein [Bacteroidales bacterium]HHU98812.1 hypothetical protein [Bacteroidales bacterium]
MTKVLENRLIEEFEKKESFTREELFQFYRYYEPELKEGTFGWRIYDLKNRNIIQPLKRGLYAISCKTRYKPDISPNLLKIAKQLSEKFSEVKHCVWETVWLNEFMQHQTSRSTLFIEVEKGFEESFFYALKDNFHREVFLNPDEKTIDFYIAESNQPIVVKRLLTRAPLMKRAEKRVKFYTPALEKILVDLFAEERLFYYLQGGELMHVYENALSNYAINFTRLFSYAKRRERECDIKQFMTNHVFHMVKDIIGD